MTDERFVNTGPEMVNRPAHYTQYEGFEVMDVCRQLKSPDGKGDWYRANVFKYLARAGYKNPDKELEDLEKAQHYLQREIDRLRERNSKVEEELFDNAIQQMRVYNIDGLPTPRYCPVPLGDGKTLCNQELKVLRRKYSYAPSYVCDMHSERVFIATEDALELPKRVVEDQSPTTPRYCPITLPHGMICNMELMASDRRENPSVPTDSEYMCKNHPYPMYIKNSDALMSPAIKPRYGFRLKSAAGDPTGTAFQKYQNGPTDG